VCTHLQGGERETSEDEVDHSGNHPWRHHDVGRLQEKGCATAAASATTAAIAHGVDFSKPKQR
jgi:hypothetical protein